MGPLGANGRGLGGSGCAHDVHGARERGYIPHSKCSKENLVPLQVLRLLEPPEIEFTKMATKGVRGVRGGGHSLLRRLVACVRVSASRRFVR
jgi:hypothetical protein